MATFRRWCMSAKLFEPESTHEASEYIARNYKKLVSYARGLGIDPAKAEDLIVDVTISVCRAEWLGEWVTAVECGYMQIEQYIYGKIKKYAMFPAYRRASTGAWVRKKADGKEVYMQVEIPSCGAEDAEEGSMPDYQLAYMNLSTYDNLEAVESEESFEEELAYVLSFDEMSNGLISRILRNLDYYKANASFLVSSGVSEMFNSFGEAFAEAFADIVKATAKDDSKLTRALRKA